MAPALSETPTPQPTPDITSGSTAISVKQSSEQANLTKKLQTELMNLMVASPPGISAFPDSESDISRWTATLVGPLGTPYENMSLQLSFEFPSNYPLQPPNVTFKTPIFHPNIDFSGRICLDILKDKWSAIYNVESVLLSLQSLLGSPNTSSPLNGQAAELWGKNPEEFRRLVLARHQEPDNQTSML